MSIIITYKRSDKDHGIGKSDPVFFVAVESELRDDIVSEVNGIVNPFVALDRRVGDIDVGIITGVIVRYALIWKKDVA